MDTFRYRQRPAKPDYETFFKTPKRTFLNLEVAKKKTKSPWEMKDLEEAIKTLKNGKFRDPEGLIREIFKEDVIGEDLKPSMLKMYNKIKSTGLFPDFMKVTNICAIYKGKGEVTDLDSDLGIFFSHNFSDYSNEDDIQR